MAGPVCASLLRIPRCIGQLVNEKLTTVFSDNTAFTSVCQGPGPNHAISNRAKSHVLLQLYHRLTRQFLLPPQLVSFGFVGCMGLATDMATFTVAHNKLGLAPLIARVFSLALATFVTWSLNRHLTFLRVDRAVGNEASRYAAVTLCAQGVSYCTFAALLFASTGLAPQILMIVGAIVGAGFSFLGHKLFSFAPKARDA
jgi:putative flippase GtrA